jgi:hypothetical protein
MDAYRHGEEVGRGTYGLQPTAKTLVVAPSMPGINIYLYILIRFFLIRN